MFNNLIESSASAKNSVKQSAFFGVTAVINLVLFVAVMIWSVFSFDVSVLGRNDNLTINTIIAPAALPENTPQPPASKVKFLAKPIAEKQASKPLDRLRNPVEDINRSTEPPRNVSTTPSIADPVREDVPFTQSAVTERALGDAVASPLTREKSSSSLALEPEPREKAVGKIEVAPPLPKTKPQAPALKKDVVMTKGVVNGTATSLPKPVYPITAKQVRAAGSVSVQVLIDEQGNVISATATNGHALLRAAAVHAARAAKFTPTKLSGQPVKVTGIIVYNFVAH